MEHAMREVEQPVINPPGASHPGAVDRDAQRRPGSGRFSLVEEARTSQIDNQQLDLLPRHDEFPDFRSGLGTSVG